MQAEQAKQGNLLSDMVCPKCGGRVYREEQECGDYHPDHENIYYEVWDSCENNPVSCNYAERYVPEENDCDMDDDSADL